MDGAHSGSDTGGGVGEVGAVSDTAVASPLDGGAVDKVAVDLSLDHPATPPDSPADAPAADAPAAGASCNLIVNGSAEAAIGSSNGTPVSTPGWTAAGEATAAQYGLNGWPAITDPGPTDRGLNLFSGGPADATSSLTQTVNVSQFASSIDTGHVTYLLSAWLGGYQGQGDNATLTVTFQSASGGALGTGTIGPVTAADRASATGLWPRSSSGAVPSGARTVLVVLTMNRTDGTANDGYADDLSLVFSGAGVCNPDGGSVGLDAASTGLDAARDVADGGSSSSKRIYAVNYNSANGSDNVTSYPADGTGDVAPIGKIAGTNTKLAGIVQMALDGSGRIYVLGKNGLTDSTQNIEIFAAGTDGNTAPIATLAGASTGLVEAVSLAVDGAGKIYVAGSIPCATCTSATHPGIMVFAAGASGNVAPQQIIAPDAYPAVDNTGLDAGDLYVGVDASGNIYVADSYSQKILVFAPGANGNVAPVRVLSGDKTLLAGCDVVAFDGTGNLYVANYNGMSVTVYAPGASGNVAPIATLTGANTGIGYLATIVVDLAGSVYASGQAVDSTGRTRSAILRFAPGANGNVAPVAALVGADTEINASSLAVH
jgi:hypothetical protein